MYPCQIKNPVLGRHFSIVEKAWVSSVWFCLAGQCSCSGWCTGGCTGWRWGGRWWSWCGCRCGRGCGRGTWSSFTWSGVVPWSGPFNWTDVGGVPLCIYIERFLPSFYIGIETVCQALEECGSISSTSCAARKESERTNLILQLCANLIIAVAAFVYIFLCSIIFTNDEKSIVSMCVNIHIHLSPCCIKFGTNSTDEFITRFHNHTISHRLLQRPRAWIIDGSIMWYDVTVIVRRTLDSVTRKVLTIGLLALFSIWFARVIAAWSHSGTHDHVLLRDGSAPPSVVDLCHNTHMEVPNTSTWNSHSPSSTSDFEVDSFFVVSHSSIQVNVLWWNDVNRINRILRFQVVTEKSTQPPITNSSFKPV